MEKIKKYQVQPALGGMTPKEAAAKIYARCRTKSGRGVTMKELVQAFEAVANAARSDKLLPVEESLEQLKTFTTAFNKSFGRKKGKATPPPYTLPKPKYSIGYSAGEIHAILTPEEVKKFNQWMGGQTVSGHPEGGFAYYKCDLERFIGETRYGKKTPPELWD